MREFRPDPTSSPEARAEDRLESWKEIAAYLRRDVNTAQRWVQREGLPVHHQAHHRLSTVYAYRSKLDAWRGYGSDEHHINRFRALTIRWLWVAATLGAIVALLAALSLGGVGYRPSRKLAPSHIHSIAVPPLQQLSGDPNEDYFIDGMTDEIIARLAQIRALKVVSRTSVIRYKQSQKSPRFKDILRRMNLPE